MKHREPPMIDHLSPREVAGLLAAIEAGEVWPGLILDAFAGGSQLRLGWDQALGERALGEILARRWAAGGPGTGAADGRTALVRAARWCAEHGLHLLSYDSGALGEEPDGERRWFMAVG